jgi:hypothetical protein
MHNMLLAVLATIAMLGHKDAYVISTGDNHTYNASIPELVAIQKRIPAKSIWVRRNGREYVIVDETTQRRALALFGPQMALGPEQDAVGREERKLDREIDRLDDEDHLTPAEKRRLSELRARMEVVEQREQELDDREEELEREAERALWPLLDEAIRSGLARPMTR